MKKMMMRMLVAVLLAMAWFGETHANPIVMDVPKPPERYVTVKFDANGGTVDAPSIRLYSGMAIGEAVAEETYKIQLPTPKRDGYKFEGWYTERTGGWKIMPSSVISTPERDSDKTVTQTVTVYAHWRMSPERYVTIKFDANGGKVHAPSIRQCCENPIELRLPTPKRNGYKFEGWYTERTGGWKITRDSMISAPEHDSDKTATQTVTVYAHWGRAPWHWNRPNYDTDF